MPVRRFLSNIYLRFSAIIASFLISTFTTKAQLCNGSLGDPVVNITFGNTGGINIPNPPPGYIFTSSACPDDGYYTIAKSTSGCFGNTWHTVSSDHTGNGAFMLVNASFDPGDFFLASVTDLCPNTTYEFAAWILNVMKPTSSILPDITFKIETPTGTVLSSFNTGQIQVTGSPVWEQYGFFFTTPANNAEIVLRITNNAPGGYGNDLALDDITFRPCGPPVDVSMVNGGDTLTICEDDTRGFNFESDVSADYQVPVFQWQLSTDLGVTWTDIPGAISDVFLRQPTGEGSYWYRMTVVEQSAATILSCRISSDVLVINVLPLPDVDAGPDRSVLIGDTISLNAQINGTDDITYYWSPTDFLVGYESLNPQAAGVRDITYTLFAETTAGCENSDQVFVKVINGIYVPSAFTPNNDGKNDIWQIPNLDPLWNAEVSVYNRFGQLVYHSKGNKVAWDGRLKGELLPTETFVYYLICKKPRLELKGTVTIIR